METEANHGSFPPKVSDIYDQVHQSMIQTPIRDNVPLFWSSMCQVKTNHYRSLAHYFVATALLDHQCKIELS